MFTPKGGGAGPMDHPLGTPLVTHFLWSRYQYAINVLLVFKYIYLLIFIACYLT